MRRQASLLEVNRSRLKPKAPTVTAEDLELCRTIDELFLLRPYYGSRRLSVELSARGMSISRGRARRLMRRMGVVAVYPKPRTSIKSPENKVYPYLLRNLEITRPNQVWCSDITYIPMRRGFAYLVVIMDWHSRAILSWRISKTLSVAVGSPGLGALVMRAGNGVPTGPRSRATRGRRPSCARGLGPRHCPGRSVVCPGLRLGQAWGRRCRS